MNRIATISIIVEQNNKETVQKVNDLLHEFQDVILGRMGIPDKSHGVNIISVAMCADEDKINALTGKLGRIDGISAKTLYSKNSY
jgi:putative iron-only hydrogenase system regulator